MDHRMKHHKEKQESQIMKERRVCPFLPMIGENSVRILCFITMMVMLPGSPVWAAVITDRPLTTGTDAIDPAGGEDVDADATGSTAQATLEGIADFSAIHKFTGFEGAGTSTTNIAAFTAATTPDIRFTANTLTGPNDSIFGRDVTTADGLSTSNDDWVAIRLPGGNGTLTYTIEFGDWDGSTFTTNSAVRAAGFTLGNLIANKSVVATAVFKDAAGNALSTQTAAGFNPAADAPAAKSAGAEYYFGHDTGLGVTGANAIASIELTLTAAGNAGVNNHPFADLGFTSVLAVPEPATLGLLGLGVLAMAGPSRRALR